MDLDIHLKGSNGMNVKRRFRHPTLDNSELFWSPRGFAYNGKSRIKRFL